MSRVCELTGKGRQVGNNVSHANNKTKRTFLPNLQNVTLISDALGQSVKLRVSTHGLRSVEHVGGLDNWLVKTNDDKLSTKARKLKREIVKKAAAGPPKPPKPTEFVWDFPERRLHVAFSVHWPRIIHKPCSDGVYPLFPVWSGNRQFPSRRVTRGARRASRVGPIFSPLKPFRTAVPADRPWLRPVGRRP